MLWLFKKKRTDQYQRPFPKNVPINVEPNSISHVGRDQHAVDFLVAEGTIVCAPRTGKIIGLKQDSEVGGADKKFENDANYVIIDHGDQETSILIHLQKDSVSVKMGDTVRAGQIIARQASTGWTYDPHIHFAVYCLGRTIPIRFAERIELPTRG